MKKKPVFTVISLVFLVLLFACKKDVGLFYYPEKMAEYLELRPEQKKDVMPVLESIQDEIFTFFKEWRKKTRRQPGSDMSSMREEFEENRIKVIDLIKTKVNTLTSYLDKGQRKKLLNIQIPELYFQEAMMLQAEYQRELSKQETSTVKVVPTFSRADIPDNLPGYNELVEHWTVTFGMQRGGSRSILLGNGGSAGNGRFPLRIKATFVDPLLLVAKNNETPANSTSAIHVYDFSFEKAEIYVSLTTSFHESYLDLNNWIVYLENDKVEQFEPYIIEKQDKPFIKRPAMFDFFSFREPEETMEESSDYRQYPGGSFFGEPPKSAYYKIEFRSKTAGEPIINRRTSYIKLVFLKEIGTDEKAEGKWEFPPG